MQLTSLLFELEKEIKENQARISRCSRLRTQIRDTSHRRNVPLKQSRAKYATSFSRPVRALEERKDFGEITS
jgi:hypothetical protein